MSEPPLPLLLLNEVYIVNAPSLIFLITGLLNFYKIRSIGFNRVVKYSTLFKVKRYTVIAIILLNVVKFTLTMFDDGWWQKYLEENKNQSNYKSLNFIFSTLRIIGVFTWLASLKLMVYQYRKGLSEPWYSLKLFWYSNFVVHMYTVSFGVLTR